jgi:uncharacterized phage-associated protein
LAKITALDVAKYFLTLNDEDAGDTISNLKMQKLVYYAQGIHLAITGKLLFKDDIHAWEHGPVIPILYKELSCFKSEAIVLPLDDFNINIFSQEQKEILNDVYAVFGQFSAWVLRNKTHNEKPWKDTEKYKIIDPKLMQEYFLTQIEK